MGHLTLTVSFYGTVYTHDRNLVLRGGVEIMAPQTILQTTAAVWSYEVTPNYVYVRFTLFSVNYPIFNLFFELWLRLKHGESTPCLRYDEDSVYRP